MGKYLQATDGILRNKTREEWELEAVANLLSTNNPAERPFGIAKAYCDIYPSMSLQGEGLRTKGPLPTCRIDDPETCRV